MIYKQVLQCMNMWKGTCMHKKSERKRKVKGSIIWGGMSDGCISWGGLYTGGWEYILGRLVLFIWFFIHVELSFMWNWLILTNRKHVSLFMNGNSSKQVIMWRGGTWSRLCVGNPAHKVFYMMLRGTHVLKGKERGARKEKGEIRKGEKEKRARLVYWH